MRQLAEKSSLVQNDRRGNARPGLLLLVAVLSVGLGAGAAFYWQSAKQKPPEPVVPSAPTVLSEKTRTVLQNLNAPVEIRFYSLLDSNSVAQTVRDFSVRVDQLLGEYERAAGGKISVVRHTSAADGNAANSAATDGVHAFNIDKGDACFLGIAVIQNDRRISLSQLSPEWESALEADLSRAVAQVSQIPSKSSDVAALVSKSDPATVEQVKRIVPDFETVPLEDGKRRLREAAFKEFKAAAEKMGLQIQAAQEKLSAAQAGQSEANKEAAVAELQRLQAHQADTLKEIAARSQAQTDALEQLKKPEVAPAK